MQGPWKTVETAYPLDFLRRAYTPTHAVEPASVTSSHPIAIFRVPIERSVP